MRVCIALTVRMHKSCFELVTIDQKVWMEEKGYKSINDIIKG